MTPLPAARLLGTVAACLAGLGATSAIAEAACDPGEAELKLSLSVPVEDTAEGDAALHFALTANDHLQGRYCVSVQSDTDLYSDAAALVAALKSGAITFAASPIGLLDGLAPKLEVLGLPFLFDSPAHAIAYLESDALRPIMAEFEDDGLHAHGVMEYGTLQMTAPRALRSPADLAGLAVGVAQSAPATAELMTLLGATTVEGSGESVGAALADGTVQAAEGTWQAIDLGGLYYEPAVVTETNHSMTGAVILSSTAFIDALPAGEYAELVKLLDLMEHRASMLEFERNQVSRQAVLEDGGRVITLSPEELAAFRAAAAPVYDAARGRIGAEIIDAAIAFNASARPFE